MERSFFFENREAASAMFQGYNGRKNEDLSENTFGLFLAFQSRKLEKKTFFRGHESAPSRSTRLSSNIALNKVDNTKSFSSRHLAFHGGKSPSFFVHR